MSDNSNLHNAKSAKNDEFYTQLSDIEKELQHYMTQLNNKVVYCNCDDYRKSKFWEYFHINFAKIGLKRLVATHYSKDGIAFKAIYEGGDDNDITKGIITQLSEDGDFRSKECLDILDESDVVVTNPPFSLFREFIATLMEHHKSFVTLGNVNAVTYKEFFPLIKNGEVWAGFSFNKTMEFVLPDEYQKWNSLTPDGKKVGKVPSIAWFTNLDIQRNIKQLNLCKKFNSDEYPMYANYNAWNVDKVSDIPINTHFAIVVDEERYKSLLNTYGNGCELIETLQETTSEGTTQAFYHVKIENPILGVPITFLNKYNPDQFKIVGITSGRKDFDIDAHPIKRYKNAIQHNKDGSTTSGSGANTGPCIAVDNPSGIYYTADNADNKLEVLYSRILIRRR